MMLKKGKIRKQNSVHSVFEITVNQLVERELHLFLILRV